jgi:hypothetical protein
MDFDIDRLAVGSKSPTFCPVGLNHALVSTTMSPVHFVGRAAELEKLGNFLHSPESQLAVVYGRRRIGKSLLLR